MTTGDLLLSLSSLASGTALSHLMSVTSGGSVIWVPAISLDASVTLEVFNVNVITSTINADIILHDVFADVALTSYSASVIENNLNGDFT